MNKENIGYNKTNFDQHNANDLYNRNICTDTKQYYYPTIIMIQTWVISAYFGNKQQGQISLQYNLPNAKHRFHSISICYLQNPLGR